MSSGGVSRHLLRSGAYYDSVVLMEVQRALAGMPGVEDAGVVMATAANRQLLADSGLLPDEAGTARADDLLVVVLAVDEGAAESALGRVDDLLARRPTGGSGGYRPKSLDTALAQAPEARWVTVSVAGRWAAGVARQALEADRHVFLYSDNVTLQQEVELKRLAAEKGLLMMGPDCGTAIVGGVGLGFANRVTRGPIGVIGASGTGLQVVTSRIEGLGGGISHALGTGSRDLSRQVGGVTFLQALDLLSRDPESEVLVLVSKPPEPAVAAGLVAAAQGLEKPVVACFLGAPPPGGRLGNVRFARGLEEAADLAVAQLAKQESEPGRRLPAGDGGFVRGLFCGGTLAQEAILRLGALLYPLHSNLRVGAALPLADVGASEHHTIVDLGVDELTVGRPHPMLDYELRLRRLDREAADPQAGVVLLDVVLGQGAHADPAGELAPAVRRVLSRARQQQRGLEVVVVLVGTDQDPQDVESQQSRLTEAGARTFRSLGEATEYVGLRLARAPEPVGAPVGLEALASPPSLVNVGLESFHASLLAQGATALQVEWRPPAGGDELLGGILQRIRKGTSA